MIPHPTPPSQTITLDGPDWRIVADQSNRAADEHLFDFPTPGSAELSERWTVFELADREPTAGELLELPKTLTVGGVATKQHAFTIESGRLDLRELLGWKAQGKSAYVYIPFTVREDGLNTFGIGADWWHKAWIDGEVISDTLATGNISSPVTMWDHRSQVQLRKGDHLLVVKFISGNLGAVLTVGGPFNFRPLSTGLKQEWWRVANFPEQQTKAIEVPGNTYEALPDYNGVAWYLRRFDVKTVPPAGRRSFLRFGAVQYLCRVWLNGQEVGGHEGAEGPFELEVTGKLVAGTNALILRVENPPGPFFGKGGGAVPTAYDMGGIKRALEMSLAASEKYLTRMEQYFDEKAGIPSHNDGPWCYLYLDFIADWLAEGVEGADRYGQSADAKMIQTNCMYIVSLDRLSKRLEVLGDGESAARYRAKAEAQRRLFHANCYKKTAANYGIDHMTYLAEPLLAEVPPKDQVDAVFRSLENNIRVVANGHPQSGDGGMANLLRYLLARNRPDLVYLMVNQTDRPSWGAMVKNGDAAIWEDWIMSPAEDPPHSRSHAGLGSIGEWFINGLAGIQCDPAQPGFQHAVLRPFIPPDMDQLAASSDSVYGTISLRWQKKGGAVTMEVAIPPNTTATLFLPTQKPDAVTEAGRPVAEARGVKLLGIVEGAVSVALESGAYAFAW